MRRLVRQQDGAAAVEFGLVAAPFLALVFAIMETAVVFFAGQALETAVADSSRLIMTGQAQTPGLRPGRVQERGLREDLRPVRLPERRLCRREEIHFVRQRQHAQSGRRNGNFQTPTSTISPGGPGDIVVVRLFYQYPVYVSLLGFNLSNVNGGKSLLAATAAFRNEPYAN